MPAASEGGDTEKVQDPEYPARSYRRERPWQMFDSAEPAMMEFNGSRLFLKFRRDVLQPAGVRRTCPTITSVSPVSSEKDRR